jgi:hypothetical protein
VWLLFCFTRKRSTSLCSSQENIVALARANTAVRLENEPNAKDFGAPPSDLANPALTTLKKRQLEAIRDRFLNYNFCARP